MRPNQATSCWLLELGNGDKFVLDVSVDAAERSTAFQMPYEASHRHANRFDDLNSSFVSGALADCRQPLRNWRPSGDMPERGAKYALTDLLKSLTRDLDRGNVMMNPSESHRELDEFYRKCMNKIVYQEGGVTVRSWSDVRTLDGLESFALQWNGADLVFMTDTYPHELDGEYARDTCSAFDKSFFTLADVVASVGFTPQVSLSTGAQVFTTVEVFGKEMLVFEPRTAVAYHLLREFDASTGVGDRNQSFYGKRLVLSEEVYAQEGLPSHAELAEMGLADLEILSTYEASQVRVCGYPPNPWGDLYSFVHGISRLERYRPTSRSVDHLRFQSVARW